MTPTLNDRDVQKNGDGLTQLKESKVYEALKRQLLAVEPMRDRAFLCLTYAVLGRVGEVVKSAYDADNPPIRREQLELDDRFLYVTLLTEKRRQERRVPVRHTILPGQVGKILKHEKWLVDAIREYANLVDGELFPYTTRWGEKIFLKHFGTENIHLLRHWRATHLLNGSVTGRPVRRDVVMKMGGWGTGQALDRIYDHTIIEDYLDTEI